MPPRKRTPDPMTPWTRDDGLDLLAQGYTPEHVAEVTGLDVDWLAGRRVPPMTRLDRLRRNGPESLR